MTARIEDPASVVAAALCVAARTAGGTGRTRRHAAPCAWCDWPSRELSAMVAAYNATAGRDERRGTWARHDVRVYTSLPRAEQVAATEAAQGIEPPPPAPADPGEESVPWA